MVIKPNQLFDLFVSLSGVSEVRDYSVAVSCFLMCGIIFKICLTKLLLRKTNSAINYVRF